MKKFLALVLSLVMAMSLVTVSAGAADFTDDGRIEYDEAVSVISAAGIVDGYEDGSFNPTGTLTRGAAAKIICNMILGPTTADALSADSAPFSDVPTNHTFAGYIAYCAQQGIISGYADGTFRPAGSLTGYAFMKMLLGALGYDSDIESYVGANWSINVAKQALAIDLDDGNDNFVGTRAVTREEACLYAFNTLKATMVEYNNTSTVIVGDVTVIGNATRHEVANTSRTDGYIDEDDKMQFAEQYFTDLRAEADTDGFGRPATTWVFDGEDVGTYANGADASVVISGASDSLSKVLTDGDYMNYAARDVLGSADVYYNGNDLGTYSRVSGQVLASKGDIVEAYEDSDHDVETIVIRSYTYAKIDEVEDSLSTTLRNRGASIGIDLVDISGTSMGTYYDNHNDDDKVLNGFNEDDYTEGTVLAVAISDEDDTTILDSYVMESITDTPTAARAVETNTYGVSNGNITMGGTRYNYAAKLTGLGDGENVDFDDEYVIYLTAEGYVLAVDGDATASLDDIYYVVGVYAEMSRGRYSYYAQAISVADGMEEALELDNAANTLAATLTAFSTTAEAVRNGYVEVGHLYDMGDDQDATTGYWTGNNRYDVYVGGLSQDVTRSSTALRLNNKVDNESTTGLNLTRVYLGDNTFFIGAEDVSTDLDVTTATGLMTVDASTSGLKVFVIMDEDDAAFVIYAAEKLAGAVNKDDVVYLTGRTTVANADGFEGELYFMRDMSNESVTVDDRANQGFYVYSVDSDGIYTLDDDGRATGRAGNNECTDTEIDGDSDGYMMGVTFDSVRNQRATSADDVFVSVSFAGATVIDTRSNGNRNEDIYSNEITSASQLASAINRGTVTADVYLEDGEIVFVAVTECENVNGNGGNNNTEHTYTLHAWSTISGASPSGNVQIVVHDDTANKWLTSAELRALRLTAEDFTLTTNRRSYSPVEDDDGYILRYLDCTNQGEDATVGTDDFGNALVEAGAGFFKVHFNVNNIAVGSTVTIEGLGTSPAIDIG